MWQPVSSFPATRDSAAPFQPPAGVSWAKRETNISMAAQRENQINKSMNEDKSVVRGLEEVSNNTDGEGIGLIPVALLI